jgi:uncharacterized protein HemX
MLALLAFFESPLGKLAGYAIMIVLAIGVTVGGYFVWRNHIQNQAMQVFNQQQMEQATKDRADFQKKLQQIDTLQNQILDNLQKQIDTAKNESDAIQEYLDSDQAKSIDRPSSEILKETIRRLSNRKK